jgi:RNA processing factor Prp31
VHFPELAKLLFDDVAFAKVIKLQGNKKSNLSQVPKEQFVEIVGGDIAEQIFKAARTSMGTKKEWERKDGRREYKRFAARKKNQWEKNLLKFSFF